MILRNTSFMLVVVAIIASVGMLIDMAQPWGDNYAYQTLTDYVQLLLFLLWVSAPYLPLLGASLVSHETRGKRVYSKTMIPAFCLLSLGCYVDATFIHLDPQSGLVFIFLPVLQWVCVAVIFIVSIFIK